MYTSNDCPGRQRRPVTTRSGKTVATFAQFDKPRRVIRSLGRDLQMLFRQDNRHLSLIVAGIIILATPQPSADSASPREATLQEAKRLAWLNNWTEAAIVLDRLELSGVIPADEGTILFARAAHIRGNIEGMSLPTAASELASMLMSSPAQNDPELRLELLAIKGDIEFQYNLPAAQATWEEALRLASTQGPERWQSRAEGELGTIAFLNGQIFDAVKLVAGALLKAELSGDVAAQIRYRTALGEGLTQFGRTADAIRFFDKALTLSASTPRAYFPFTAYIGKARLLVSTGRADEGFQMLYEGLNEARRKGLKVREARSLTVLGELSALAGKQDEAVEWLTAAAQVARSAGLDRIEADASSTLASLLRDAGKLSMAIVYAERSVAASQNARDLFHLPQRMAVLAEIETVNGDTKKAAATYAQATDLVAELLRNFPHPRHKNTLIGTMGRVFQGHFEILLVGLKDFGKAFQVLESAKARGLAELLGGSSNMPYVSAPWDPQPAHQVAMLQRKLSTEQDPSQRSRLLDRLWELEQRSFRLSTLYEPSHAISLSSPVSVHHLQSQLRKDELIIEYVLGPARSYALAISRYHTAHYELRSRREIETAVESHSASAHGKGDGRSEGKSLYQLLLQPVPVLEQYKRLVIIPDGKLNLVAFEALLDSKERYVVETHTVSYAPSATVYGLLSKAEAHRTDQLAMLGVGGARYVPRGFEDSPLQVRGSGLFNPSAPPHWTAIPQSLAEVNDVAASQIGKTMVLTGDNATEAELKRFSLSSFRVLHLALHSTIDEEFPDRSALVLTSRKNDQEDGLLQAREILSLDLDSELVTLSACDAGAGTLEGIAGMDSLVQSFLMAGSRSVVASIWPADDVFTAALMRRFYANLRHGFDKAESLTLAKRELLRINGPNTPPFYWAGFRLVGDSHGTVTGE